MYEADKPPRLQEDERSISPNPKTAKLSLLVAWLVVLGLAVLSLFTGAYDLFGQSHGWEMFLITRIPRTAALMLAGSALSIAGLVMQLMTQNRFVEPTTTGTTEWAGLGILVIYALNPAPTLLARMSGSIVASFLGTMVFFLFMKRIRLRSSLMVPIVGMMLGAVVSAFSTFFSLTMNLSQSIESWFQGSFAPVQRGRYEYLWLIIVSTLLIYLFADRLTVAGLGESVTTSLGLNYQSIILIGTALVSISVGLVAAVIGNLPFLGLIVPNIVSRFRGDHLRQNLPWVAVVGMGTILVADILSRVLIAPFEVPVSLILGTLGATIFVAILLRTRRTA